MFVQFYSVAEKESLRITSTRPRTVGRASCSDRELLCRNWSKTQTKVKLEEIWQWKKRNVVINIRFSVMSLSEQREALFIGSELYPLLTASAQFKRIFRLDAINVQQLRTFVDLLLSGQEMLQIKTVKYTREWDGAREYSESKCSGNTSHLHMLRKDSEVQVLRMIPSPSVRGSLRDHSWV